MAYAEEKSKDLSENDKADLLEQFKADLGESKSFMEPIQQRMDRDYESYRNHKQGSRFEEIDFRISDLYEYVETVVPIITNNRIRASVRSDYNEYVTHAKGMNDILDNTYDINNWDYMQQELMRMALINRSALAYTGYDTKYRNGTGKLCIDICNSRWAWFDPSPTNFEDSRFFFYAIPMRKTQVFKMYPDKVNDIKASLVKSTSGFSKGNENNTNDKSGSWFKTFIGTIKNYLVFNGTNQAVRLDNMNIVNDELSEQQKHKNVIAYIEYWYRDDNDEWRKSCWADDVLLEDEPNPFAHGRLPYDVLSPVKDPYSVLGIPISEQLESIAYQRNAMLNYVVTNAKLHADPPFLWNTTYGNVKDPAQLKEQGGRNIIPVNNPDMIPLNAIADYMNVPVLPGYTVQMFDQLGAIKDTVTGVNDSFRGTQQGTSGKEVQLQQEAAYTRIKTMIDQFELFNKNIAEKIIVNAMQFYTQHREFRIKGDYQKYEFDQQRISSEGGEMPFDIERVQKGVTPEGDPVYDRAEFFMFANPNEWTKIDPEKEEGTDEEQEGEDTDSETTETSTAATDGTRTTKSERKSDEHQEDKDELIQKAFKVLQMTVEIEAGSSLPQSRLARREEALELYSAQALDQEALLDAYDWPNREEVIKRMQDNQAKAAEAQSQAAQAEAQGKIQAAQLDADTKIKIKEMDLQQTQMQSDAKIAQQEVQNKGDVAEKGVENSGNSLAEIIDQVRQANPQAEQLSDDEILQAVGGVQ